MNTKVFANKNKKIKNVLFPIYYWGFTFLKPFLINFPKYSTLILSIYAIILFIVWVFYFVHNGSINNAVFVGLGFLLILLIDMFARGDSLTFEYVYRYLYSGFMIILFVSIISDSKDAIYAFSVLSLLAFLAFFYDPFQDYKLFGDYMTYGFSLILPSFIGIFILCHYFKKYWLIPIELFCFGLIMIYANRSAFLSAVIFILIYNLFAKKKERIILVGFFLVIIAMLLFLYHDSLLLLRVFNQFNLDTYAIRQFIGFLQSGDIKSFFSGRLLLWENAWQMFLKKPFLGNGVDHFQFIYGSYPHNIFLDILAGFGIIGFFIVIFLMINSSKKIFKHKDTNKVLGLMLLGLWFPKLIFSVSYVWDSGFWAFVAYGFLHLTTNIETNNSNIKLIRVHNDKKAEP